MFREIFQLTLLSDIVIKILHFSTPFTWRNIHKKTETKCKNKPTRKKKSCT